MIYDDLTAFERHNNAFPETHKNWLFFVSCVFVQLVHKHLSFLLLYSGEKKKKEKPHYKQCERTKCLWNQANNKKNIINFLRLFLGWKSSRSDRYIWCVCAFLFYIFFLNSLTFHIFTLLFSHISTVIGIDACNCFVW